MTDESKTVTIDAKDVPALERVFDGGLVLRVAHSFQVRLDGLSAMSGESLDTIVRIDVDPQGGYPDPQAVALVYYAAKAKVLDVDEFELFRDDVERDTGHRVQEIIDRYPQIFEDAEKALRFVFAGAKRVHGVPPLSCCPRCGLPLWPATYAQQPPETAAAHLKARPRPAYCLDCGQRFQYDKVGRLKCSDEMLVEDVADALESRAVQPQLDLTPQR